MEIKTDINYDMLFNKNDYRHLVYHGGRGGGKSYHIALAELLNARTIKDYSKYKRWIPGNKTEPDTTMNFKQINLYRNLNTNNGLQTSSR